MPIISFSQKDLLRGKPVTPGWYHVKIEAVGEKPSKDGGSTNYPVEGTILYNADNGDKEFEGYPIDWNFNSKAIGFMTGFFEAFGVELKPGQRFELASTVNREIDMFISNKEYDGRIINNVDHKYRAPREVST